MRSYKTYVAREIIHQSLLRHPLVVNLREVFLTPSHLGIAMEYVPGGDLHTYLQGRPGCRLPEGEARWLFQQLIIGIDYCHRRGEEGSGGGEARGGGGGGAAGAGGERFGGTKGAGSRSRPSPSPLPFFRVIPAPDSRIGGRRSGSSPGSSGGSDCSGGGAGALSSEAR